MNGNFFFQQPPKHRRSFSFIIIIFIVRMDFSCFDHIHAAAAAAAREPADTYTSTRRVDDADVCWCVASTKRYSFAVNACVRCIVSKIVFLEQSVGHWIRPEADVVFDSSSSCCVFVTLLVSFRSLEFLWTDFFSWRDSLFEYQFFFFVRGISKSSKFWN